MSVQTGSLIFSTIVLASAISGCDHSIRTDAPIQPLADFTVPACRSYFQSAIWRFDTGPGLWSLSLTPTSCTRSLNGATSSTGLVIDAVIRDHSGDPHWLEGNNTRGVRDQIICHLAEFPNKSEWNVEPGRPDVGYGETVRRNCNP